MNKYKEALSSITFTMHYRVKPKKLGKCEDANIELLEELVGKEMPLPLDDSGEIDTCPSCQSPMYDVANMYDDILDYIYCPVCGKKIKMPKLGDEDE